MPPAAHGVTHPGRRTTNEDAMLVDAALGLFVVADGMGGHNAGEVASAIAVGAIRERVAEAAAPAEGELADSLRVANGRILEAAAREPACAGMGTTVVAALVRGDRVVYGHVGDSRIYQWRRGTLTQLTRDDSWMSHVLPDAALSPEDAQRHPMRHVLTKVVGLRDDMEPAVDAVPFLDGDILLLCSDGLHGAVPDEIIAATLGGGASVREMTERLVDQAMSGGATDNITAVVIRRE
jgi:protein phosphatase